MLIRQIIRMAVLAPGLAAPLAAADYVLAPAALDHGGRQAASANYSASFSAAPGAVGTSANYRLRSGYAAQLFDPDTLPAVDFIPPGSLAADGSGKDFSATAAGVGGLRLMYEGRGFTSYALSGAAPVAPGLYRVKAAAISQDYTGNAHRDFVITGPIAGPDAITKAADHSPVAITVRDLLANDRRVLPDGSLSADGLSVIGVTAGPGNGAFLGEGEDEGWVFFMPSAAATEAFAYAVSDGQSSANGVVSVVALGAAPAFSLQIVRRGNPEFDGSRTTLAMDFIGVPGQNYQVEWSSDLSTWTSAGTIPTGPTGSFTVSFGLEGDHVSSWSQRMFFRAKR